METVKIKQIEHPDNKNLSAKYIGAREYLTPRDGKDGKIITGIDENAYSLQLIEDDKKRKAAIAELKKERENLERQLGVDLGPTSEFWRNFYIVLEDERELVPGNPLDRLHELFLIANRYVAPSREAVDNDPDFYNCFYYIYREADETSKKAKAEREKDKAVATLYNLNDKEPNKLKMVAADIFGYEDPEQVKPEAAYVKLKEFLEPAEKKAQAGNIKMFLDSVNKTPEQIMAKKIFDKAIKRKFITAKGGIYKREDVVYGYNYDEALEFLSSVENSSELTALRRLIGG